MPPIKALGETPPGALAESPTGAPVPVGVALTVALAMLLASLGTSIANIALPTLATAFAAPFGDVQAVVVAYLATLTFAVLVAGRLGDRYGLRPMLIVGLALFALAALFSAVAPSLPLLVGARALQGVGAAFLMTLAMALMRAAAPAARLGRSMGLLGTLSALGTALGPALGGVLLPLTGWRGLFWIQLPPTLLALGLAVLALRGARAGAVRPAAAATIGFWGSLDRRLMVNLGINALVAAVMMATLMVGPFYLALGLRLPAAAIGGVMAIGPVLSILGGVPAGRLVDHLGPNRVLMLGLGLLFGGAMMLALLPDKLGVTGYGLAVLVLTPGYQFFQAANNTATLKDVAADRRGTVSGLLALSRNLGLIGGASVMGAVFASGVGDADPTRAGPAAIAAGMRSTFVAAAGLMLVALAMAALDRRAARRRA